MPPNKVFISATSTDLGGMRQRVKDALLTMDCYPVEQTHFAPDWREVEQMLRARIADCQALIHIVGLRYGAEPNPATLPEDAPRHSYTQMEYHIGRELQRKRGDKRFRVYTFVLPEDFPYDAPLDAQTDEQQALQLNHRTTILDGSALYETPPDPSALEQRVLALREEVLQLRAAQNRRARLTLTGVLFILLALVGIGYGMYHLPRDTAEHIAHQLDAEAVAIRLRQEIRARFQSEAQAARAASKNWEAIHELERRRDAALGRVDEIILTINEGLATNPSPIFIEATRILEQEGAEAAIAYLESHKTAQLARADRAAAQLEAAQETLQRELRPLILQAELHETRLEWDQALALLQAVSDKAPQWFEVRLKLGGLLDTLARYTEAEPHKRAAVRLARTPDEEATAINNLAQLLKATNRLAEAEPIMRRALKIDEASFGPEHPKVAIRLNNLAQLLKDTNRLEEAEPLMRRALKIDEASFGPEHPKVAIRLNNFALLLQATNRLAEAEPLMRRALTIDETSFGPEHPKVAIRLNNLAQLLQATNRLAEAEPLMRRALAIDEASFGPEHPNVARDLNNLAQLLQATNRLEEAEPIMRRALAIDEASFGPEHPDIAIDLNNLALLLQATHRLAEAEPLMRRALAIDEASFGPEHPDVATDLNNLAQLLQATHRLAEAEPLSRQMVEILLLFKMRTGHAHPHWKAALGNYQGLLAALGRDEAAQQVEIEALMEAVKKKQATVAEKR